MHNTSLSFEHHVDMKENSSLEEGELVRIFNRKEIEVVLSSLANYLHLMRRRRRFLTFMYATQRRRSYERKEGRLIAQLQAFFDYVEKLNLFLDMFDLEYKCQLDAQLEMEEGEAYLLWHDMCDNLDYAAKVHDLVLKLLHALDTYARALTLTEKRESIMLAKHNAEELQHNLRSALLTSKKNLDIAAHVIHQLFQNCISEIVVVTNKLDVVFSLTSFKK